MFERALITGASSGLGAEYARQFAGRGTHVVLVARDTVALERLAVELRTLHTVVVEVLPADLLTVEGIGTVEARLRDTEAPIDTLVNNAGFGLPLSFEENPQQSEVDHLRLHNEVPLRLIHTALQRMLASGQGSIINVSSVAAFIPRGTYAAAKQWLVGFSRWANARYKRRGVTVTAVCPGFTHTNFHERLGLPPGQEGVPGWMWLDAPQVIAESLRDVAKRRGLSIPSVRYKVLASIARVAPTRLAVRIGERGRNGRLHRALL